jgi:hypothetical protein
MWSTNEVNIKDRIECATSWKEEDAQLEADEVERLCAAMREEDQRTTDGVRTSRNISIAATVSS